MHWEPLLALRKCIITALYSFSSPVDDTQSVTGITILNLCIQNKGKPICHGQWSIKPLINKPLKLGKLADVHLAWESQLGGTPLHLWCTWFKRGVSFFQYIYISPYIHPRKDSNEREDWINGVWQVLLLTSICVNISTAYGLSLYWSFYIP